MYIFNEMVLALYMYDLFFWNIQFFMLITYVLCNKENQSM